MAAFILALVLVAVALLGMMLLKAYSAVPPRELKRQARRGDARAAAMYRAAAYGSSLRLLLWLVVGLALAGGLVICARLAPPLIAVAALAGVVWYGFVWLPSGNVTGAGGRLAAGAAPALAAVLNYLHPLTDGLSSFVRARRPVVFHTGLFEREDLIDLLESQKQQPDSRISHQDVDMAIRALSFGDHTAADIMVPRRAVKQVRDSDPVGPVLMDELHSSGHSRFPVYAGKRDNIVGILHLAAGMASGGGQAGELAQRPVCYVHSDYSLGRVLQAFLTTRQSLLVVIDSHGEYMGIVTIESVVEQLLGYKLEDDFDGYDSRTAVAAQPGPHRT